MLSIRAFFSIINFAVLGPTCIYMEKSGRRKEGHPLSPVDFSKHLYENKVDPFAQAKSWQQCLRMLWLPCLDQVYPAKQAKVAQRVTLPLKKGDTARWVILVPKPTFCKEMKSWLIQGSWGERATFLATTISPFTWGLS